jgi:hypothetical protein
MNSIGPPSVRSSLKQTHGWFAATDSFRQALLMLSDGAFRLFAYLCLQADRHTGCLQATPQELATALGKPRPIIGGYWRELEQKQICQVRLEKDRFGLTRCQIQDRYWPYHRSPWAAESSQSRDYVESVRQHCLELGCGPGQFGAWDEGTVQQWHSQGMALGLVEAALLLGACRKYVSWINGASTEPIRTVSYFEPLIRELQQYPLSDSYRNHLRTQLPRLAQKWTARGSPRPVPDESLGT